MSEANINFDLLTYKTMRQGSIICIIDDLPIPNSLYIRIFLYLFSALMWIYFPQMYVSWTRVEKKERISGLILTLQINRNYHDYIDTY
jgi:hypothetical protein